MSNHSVQATTTQQKALDLLVSGVPQNQVASALGCTDALVSQFLADESFREELIRRKYELLVQHNSRDAELDKLEDLLIEKMKAIIPFLYKPLEISRIFQQINAAKRRGTSSIAPIATASQVTNLTLPIKIVQQFQVNINNQVVKAGSQDLVTIQSGKLSGLLDQVAKKGQNDVLPIAQRIESSGPSPETSRTLAA